MIITVLLFAAGLICLIKGGDWFVDGSVNIARRFSVPEILIGATIVSIGTTLPEVMVSATSAFGGKGDIAYGNAIGSIICNTSLIAAITLAVRPGRAERKNLIIPVIFFFASAVLYAGNAYTTGFFSRGMGFLLLAIFAVYIIVSVSGIKSIPSSSGSSATEGKATKDIVMLVIGAGVIAVGARLVVDNGILIAKLLGVPQSVIALTFVALGTSLPELVTAITSLVKGHGALSLGNIIGANLFNLVLVSGVSVVVSPFSVPQSSTLFGYNSSLVLDIPVMFAVMLLLVIPPLVKERLTRLQGITLLAIYTVFCVIQFTM